MEKIKNKLYIYRYDIFSLTIMSLVVYWILTPIYRSGHIVFSDIAFPFDSSRYLEEIFGLWNERWSTSTMLNVPRLLYILPVYIFSSFFNHQGEIFIKAFITLLIMSSAISMYLFSKRLVSVYLSKDFNFFRIFSLITGGLFYALNPWILFRIQHIYLLCGYSLFPLVLMFFFNIFDPKFQAQLIPNYYQFDKKIHPRHLLDIFLLAFFFTMASAAIHYFFYGVLFLGALFGLLLLKSLIVNRKYGIVKLKTIVYIFFKKGFILGIFIFILSFHWLSIYFGSILMKAQASQHNINVVDTLSLFSRNSSLKNVVYLISYWWPMFNIENLPLTFYFGGSVLIFFIIVGAVFRSYKHNIIAFFSILAVIFIVFSTGVSLDGFADIFVLIVTKTPIFGNIFRDPNKLIGLLAINFSVLLIFGVIHIIEYLKNNLFHDALKILIVCIVVISFWFYIQPFHYQFIEGFYHPIDSPKEFFEVQNNFRDIDNFESKVLYLPIADNMTQSHTGVATPKWNKNPNEDGILKATGDIHVYSSLKNTVFHHEGNPMSITYFLNFIQYIMDQGLTTNLKHYISAFGVNELAYHNEYIGHEDRQNFNQDLINMQDGLIKHYSDDIFTLYDLKDSLPYMFEVSKKIFTSYGFSHFESISNINNFNLKDFAIIYSSLDENTYLNTINEGDYIEAINFNDVFLSNLPREYYVLPFEFVHEANPFLKWAKTLIKTNEWLWFMSSQDIKNFPFDFDFGGGIAVSFATSKLNVLPYKLKDIEGKLIADFDSLLRTDNFFVPDNPQLFNIAANPMSDTNMIPSLHGKIVKGDPKNIWQVAKSGILEAKENNPYRFKILMSGRGANKIHVKIRFFNENMEELGISYVVAPSEEIDFDGIDFFGEYVSPKDSKYMRLELLSFQRPEQKVYWWIHDVELLDLEEYKVPNTFTIEKHFDKETKAKVYMRSFVSKKGGEVGISFDFKETKVNTFDTNINQFKWFELGEFDFKAGKNELVVENIKGFNALNMFVIIPSDEYKRASFPVKTALKKSNIFFALEAENDFSYTGNMQTNRTVPTLSLGRGISSQNGRLEREFEIIKSGDYLFSLKANIPSEYFGNLLFKVLDFNNNIIYSTYFNNFKSNKSKQDLTYVADFDNLKIPFPREFIQLKDTLSNYNTVETPLINLQTGKYKLVLDFDSKVPSLSTFDDFHKFLPEEINVPEFLEDIFQEDCSDCTQITLDMMNHTISNDVFRIDYDKTCSCDWYVYASKKILVEELEEYLVSFEAKSEIARKRHTKIFFLNENLDVINTAYINEVAEKDKFKWNKYEQIVKVPKKAKYMMFHIWARGNKINDGYLEMKNFSIIPYKKMILVDALYMFENESITDFLKPKISDVNLSYSRVDSMERNISIDNPNKEDVLINFMESPNPLWEMRLDKSQRGTMTLNAVSTGFVSDRSGDGTIVIILKKIYFIGLFMIVFGILLFLISFYFLKRRK